MDLRDKRGKPKRTEKNKDRFMLIIVVTLHMRRLLRLVKTWSTRLTKGQILSMHLIQTNVEKRISLRDTIDVALAIYYDGTI